MLVMGITILGGARAGVIVVEVAAVVAAGMTAAAQAAAGGERHWVVKGHSKHLEGIPGASMFFFFRKVELKCSTKCLDRPVR